MYAPLLVSSPKQQCNNILFSCSRLYIHTLQLHLHLHSDWHEMWRLGPCPCSPIKRKTGSKAWENKGKATSLPEKKPFPWPFTIVYFVIFIFTSTFITAYMCVCVYSYLNKNTYNSQTPSTRHTPCHEWGIGRLLSCRGMGGDPQLLNASQPQKPLCSEANKSWVSWVYHNTSAITSITHCLQSLHSLLPHFHRNKSRDRVRRRLWASSAHRAASSGPLSARPAVIQINLCITCDVQDIDKLH